MLPGIDQTEKELQCCLFFQKDGTGQSPSWLLGREMRVGDKDTSLAPLAESGTGIELGRRVPEPLFLG